MLKDVAKLFVDFAFDHQMAIQNNNYHEKYPFAVFLQVFLANQLSDKK